jgi:chromate transporter
MIGTAEATHGDPEAPGNEDPPRIGVLAIFLAFLKLGSTAFGGGTAGWLYRDIVVRRGWLSNERFLTMLAVGQALPGANGLKATVLIGQYLHGPLGSAAALSGLLAGPFVIILAVAGLYSGFGDHPIVHAVLDGMAAGAIGLTFDTGLRSVTHGSMSPASLAITAATVVCVGILRWPILPVLLGLGPAGIALAWLQRR